MAAAEERLEHPLCILRCHAGSAVRDLEIWSRARAQAADAHFDGRAGVAGTRVANRVVTQIPDDLMKLRRIDAHLDVRVGRRDLQALLRPLCRFAELAAKFF